jgi:hypothetical protein
MSDRHQFRDLPPRYTMDELIARHTMGETLSWREKLDVERVLKWRNAKAEGWAMRFDPRRRKARQHPFEKLLAAMLHPNDVNGRFVVFRRYRLSRKRHRPYKESQRARERRAERRFVLHQKGEIDAWAN